ncbi:MAG: hypothetical protein WC797_03970 [Candidatus Paceibacterota bacterium]|jgi:hypothetical protein
MKNIFKSLAFLTVILLGMQGVVFAAEAVPEDLKPLADRLGCQSKEECEKTFSQNFDSNFQLANQLGVYDKDPAVKGMADSYQGQVMSKLQEAKSPEEFEKAIIQAAQDLLAKDPTAAKKLGVESSVVKRAEKVAEAAVSAGVTVEECKVMDPETAPVEKMRACFKLAKDPSVQSFMPDQAKDKMLSSDNSLKLREALVSGKYQCGDNTVNGCGNFCLNPDAAAKKAGIPEICKTLANEFFGKDGAAELEKIYKQVEEGVSFYNKKAENSVFVTVDGKVLYDSSAIGFYLQEQGMKGNMDAVEKGMDFMIANGWRTEKDKKDVLDMFESLKASGADLNTCAKDPQSCMSFMPEDQKNSFGAGLKVSQIMKEEMAKEGVTGDPQSVCDMPENGEACYKASKMLSTRLEELLKSDPGAKEIVDEIKSRILEGDNVATMRQEAEKRFSAQTKAGQKIFFAGKEFNNQAEVDQFCASNGQLCLADASKMGMIPKGFIEKKVQKTVDMAFQQGQFGMNPMMSQQFAPGTGPSDFSQQGMFPGGNQFGPGFNQSFVPAQVMSPEEKQKAIDAYTKWLDNPVGAPPVSNTSQPSSSDSMMPPPAQVSSYPQGFKDCVVSGVNDAGLPYMEVPLILNGNGYIESDKTREVATKCSQEFNVDLPILKRDRPKMDYQQQGPYPMPAPDQGQPQQGQQNGWFGGWFGGAQNPGQGTETKVQYKDGVQTEDPYAPKGEQTVDPYAPKGEQTEDPYAPKVQDKGSYQQQPQQGGWFNGFFGGGQNMLPTQQYGIGSSSYQGRPMMPTQYGQQQQNQQEIQCPNGETWDPGRNGCVRGFNGPVPVCPQNQWWDQVKSMCVSSSNIDPSQNGSMPRNDNQNGSQQNMMVPSAPVFPQGMTDKAIPEGQQTYVPRQEGGSQSFGGQGGYMPPSGDQNGFVPRMDNQNGQFVPPQGGGYVQPSSGMMPPGDQGVNYGPGPSGGYVPPSGSGGMMFQPGDQGGYVPPSGDMGNPPSGNYVPPSGGAVMPPPGDQGGYVPPPAGTENIPTRPTSLLRSIMNMASLQNLQGLFK